MHLIWFYSKKNIYKLNKFEYYKICFSDLKNKWINIVYFYEEDNNIILDEILINKINKIWVDIIPFYQEAEVINYLLQLKWKIFINTFEEQEIRLVNRIRTNLNQVITKNPEIFLNKYLQRSIIWWVYPETVINYKLLSAEDAKIIKKTELLKLPFIIKPTWWVQSSWVLKINNYNDYQKSLNYTLNALEKLKDKKLTDQKILLEEFIDGDMYTIDYYVDEKQKIIKTKAILVKLGFDYWVKDFSNIVRIISKDVENSVDENKLNDFIKKTVIAGDIKNTFIHHEFKINSKWEFKTIETNWRIGWYRLEMYQIWYDINLWDLPFSSTKLLYELKNNIAVFALYPKKDWIFNWFNDKILAEIEWLKSFYRTNKWIKKIWDNIGLTKNWYGKVWSIVIFNKNYKQFKKDLEFIENVYFEILKLK